MRRNTTLLLAAVTLAALASAQRTGPPVEKDMDEVTKLYLAPFTTEDPQNAAFRAALKTQLVHEGFVVFEKKDNTDATLLVEITSGQDGKGAKLEFHAFLDAGPDSKARWNLSQDKQGADLGRLIENAARNIASNLHSYRTDVRTKKREENEKKKNG